MHYVYGHNDIIARFVAQMIPHVGERGFGNCTTIGILADNGDLIAGIVYHDWSPEAGVIAISAAALPGKHWLTRETLRVMYGFPFDQLGCQMVIKAVPHDDERLLGELARGGFSFVRVPRLLGRDRDCIICTLTDDDWASSRFNQHKRADEMKEAA